MEFNKNNEITFNQSYDVIWGAIISAVNEITNLSVGSKDSEIGEIWINVGMFGSNQIPIIIKKVDEQSCTITIDWNEQRKEMNKGSYPYFTKNKEIIEAILLKTKGKISKVD